jgi:CRP-like cAMP-binding protein
MLTKLAAPPSERNRVGSLLATKLSSINPFAAADHEALMALPYTLRQYRRENAIALTGSSPNDLLMIVDGFAARSKITRWGEHPIVGFLLPGDVFDWPLFALKMTGGDGRNATLDHSVSAMTTCTVAAFRAQAVASLVAVSANITRAFEAAAIIDQNILREWLANIGARPAAERLAHLLCEHFHRMKAMGMANGRSCYLPFTQSRLSASQGLSIVHTNRVLKRLHDEGLLHLHGRILHILDQERLEAFADFSPSYLSWRY